MQEKNRHILIDGINKLPEHKAPDELWNNIETMILSVQTDILPIHKPAEATWSAIEAGINQNIFLQKTTYKSLAIMLLILLLGSAATIYFSGNYFTSPAPAEKSNLGIVTTNEQGNSKQEDSLPIADKSIDIIEDISIEVPVEAREPTSVQTRKTNEYKSNINSSNKTALQFHNDLNITVLKPIETTGYITNQQNILLNNNSLNKIPPDQSYHNTSKHDPFQDCNFQHIEQNYHVGPGFEYQYFLNSVVPENTKLEYWYSADIRIQYQRNRFLVETGIGISFSKDNIDFTYDYLTNELVNTYEYVDSVYYDPITGTTEYYTTTVEVYDSIPYSTKSSSETSYTYLQIPLDFGYEVWRVKKFSLSIKAGITYFKELTAKETQPNLYHENSRITSINTSNISRNKELFRISGGIGFNWNLNSKIKFTLNPTFNYFLNQIYDNEDNITKPIAGGMRFGFYYKL